MSITQEPIGTTNDAGTPREQDAVRLIDTDVHHTWRNEAELLGYLSSEWKDYVYGDGRRAPLSIHPERGTSYMLQGALRLEAYPEDGSTPGSDYELMREQLLDVNRPEAAVLTFGVGQQSGLLDPYFAAALCRAANDWNLDHWLSHPDDRLCGLILVPPELPEEAAKEIRRCAGRPRTAGVLLVANNLGKPLGHPVFHPIFAAAAECDLPIVVHVGGEAHLKGIESAGGTGGGMIERYELLHQPAMHYVTSMVTHGLFETFPSMRVMFLEFGFLWLPPLMWRLDSLYKVLRAERPAIKRLPSETIAEHMKFSIQPLDYVPRQKDAVEAVRASAELRSMLCFSSDYPHWDADEPKYVASHLPREWKDQVMYDNAKSFYGARVGAGAASS